MYPVIINPPQLQVVDKGGGGGALKKEKGEIYVKMTYQKGEE